MRRLLTLFGCALILWAIVSQLNHSLTPWRIHLFVGGLFVAMAALTQPLTAGILCSAGIGLVFDANAPVAFGTHLVLFCLAHVLVYRVRERVPRNDTVSRVTVAVLANLGVFLVFSFLQVLRTPGVSGIWPRALVDLLFSQVALTVIAPWYFALQARSLALAGCERENFA